MTDIKLSAADVIAEACLLFHWTADYILSMPAVRFFALVTSGRKIHAKNEAWRTVFHCDAASVALGDAKYYEEMRRFYLQAAMGQEAIEKDSKKRALDPTSEAAKALVSNLFEQAQRFT